MKVIHSTDSVNQTSVSRKNIKIGFMSYDMNDHPTSHLCEGIFYEIKKSRDLCEYSVDTSLYCHVELFIFNYGKNDNSSYRNQLMQVCLY